MRRTGVRCPGERRRRGHRPARDSPGPGAGPESDPWVGLRGAVAGSTSLRPALRPGAPASWGARLASGRTAWPWGLLERSTDRSGPARYRRRRPARGTRPGGSALRVGPVGTRAGIVVTGTEV